MKRYIISASLLAALYGMSANAGSLDLPPQPIVTPPAQPLFSWTGPYAGVSAGTTRTKHKRATYGQRDMIGERPTFGEEITERPMLKRDMWKAAQAGECDTLGLVGYDIDGCTALANFGEEHLKYWGDHEVPGYTVTEMETVQTGTEEYVTGTERYQTGTETYRQSHATYGAFAGYRHQFGTGIVLGGELAGHHFSGGTNFEAKAQAGYALGRALPYLTAGYDFTDETAIYGAGFDYALTDRWIAGVEYTQADKTGTDRISARLAFKF